MANTISIPWLFLLAFACNLFFSCGATEPNDNRKEYIVYMGERPKGDSFASSLSSLHLNMLEEVLDDSKRASDSLIYSYKRSFNGFVATLTEAEKERVTSMDGVVSVFPNRIRQLQTTRSWDFVGFPQNAERRALESDTIIGVFDTGIWPESASFNDSGFGPPPKKWKGTCQASKNFTCNKKIIGAKYYYHSTKKPGPKDILSPRDSEGHGSHTASTAAGCLVSKASLFGLGSGTARGAVPSARIAVYKVCWSYGCADSNTLAAFDDAIADGVDIISVSIAYTGLFEVRYNYFEDPIAIGAFHAMRRGILTSNAAGNDGPTVSTISNYSPWSLTVAASAVDRKFVTNVVLGNNKTYQGISVNTFKLDKFYPLVYGGDTPNASAIHDPSYSMWRYCMGDTLNKTEVSGKIVFCDTASDGSAVLHAGGVGTIMHDGGYNDSAFTYPLSASYLGTEDATEIINYINTTSKPTAIIQKSIEIIDKEAPYVASFSSRGPNPITADILKPDITAPGLDIVAAWSEATAVTPDPDDKRVVKYNIELGTSMACPHATGAAAYVKSFNPTWSPAAIKSALMTTATVMTSKINTDAEFAYGSGQINPIKAAYPGLVYDMNAAGYVSFLCGQGYDTPTLRRATGDNATCTKENNATVWDLNYPSFTLSAKSGEVTRVFHRTVTNVGNAESTYTAKVNAPPQLKIQVNPSVLSFKSLGQKQSFTVTVTATISKGIVSGSLVWDDGVHQVRSPIVAHSNASPDEF